MMEWNGIQESFFVSLVEKSEICSNQEAQLLFWKVREYLVIQKTDAKVPALDLGKLLCVPRNIIFMSSLQCCALKKV